jgi:hypothetical protein
VLLGKENKLIFGGIKQSISLHCNGSSSLSCQLCECGFNISLISSVDNNDLRPELLAGLLYFFDVGGGIWISRVDDKTNDRDIGQKVLEDL